MNGLVAEKIGLVVKQERVRFKSDTCQWIEVAPLTEFIWSRESEKESWHFPKLRPLRVSQVSEELEKTFQDLASRWREETAGMASPTKKMLNFNYLKILTLTKAVVPLIIKELAKRPDDWFLALRLLTEENPVKPEDSENFKLVTESWLKWGRGKGYL
jgi:hypothetical protein